TSWQARVRGLTISYNQIAFGGGMYMAVGDSGAVVSSDGLNWTKKYANNLRELTGVTYGNNMFVAVSRNGRIFAAGNSGAGDWQEVNPSMGETLLGVAYSGNGFVAVGTPSVIYVSANGISWTRLAGQTSGWNIAGATQNPTSITFGNGLFWAGSNNRLFSSANGAQWTEVAPPALSGLRVTSITYANNRFTGALGIGGAGGPSNRVITSTDGTSWQVLDGPENSVRSVTYANGYYIAVGDSGRVFTSNNGQTWSARPRVTNRNLMTVFSNADNVLLAAGASGAMLYSTTQDLSVRHNSLASRTAQGGVRMMSVDMQRSTPRLMLSFAAPGNAKVSFYSLSGKRLYTHRLKAGERSIELPGRITQNGVIIAQYTNGDQKFSQRFQFTK
ncbi:MAG: hypothetical protein FWE57_09870, partial [Chitinispirillia bacterium]|nr:hypothetical protein [Chitinispirillia bacterium]